MSATRSRGLAVGITSLLGAAAFWRRRQKRRAVGELPAADSGADPAEELRAKLAESRATENAVAPDEPIGATDADASQLDPETRRKSVHDRTRASIDELK
jgi:hypothetical protein